VLTIQFDYISRLGSTHTNESSAAGKHVDFTCELVRPYVLLALLSHL
jgi:hypothetical protein